MSSVKRDSVKMKVKCLDKLEDMAFLVIYRSILDHLLQVPLVNCKNGHLIESVAGAGHDKEAADRVKRMAREMLDAPGNQNQEIRGKLLKYYYQGRERKDLRLSCFLDVVLNESVHEITTSFDDEDGYLDEQVMPTIIARCPLARALNVHCSAYTNRCLPKTLASNLVHLKQLKCLNLYQLPVQCKCIAFLVGQCCPLLTQLRIDLLDDNFTADELIRIFYAGDLDDLNKEARSINGDSCRRKAYHRCQVSAKSMYPFCGTLEQVRIIRFDCDDPYVIAFLLRHLAKLKQLETSDYEYKDYSSSIRVLWEITDPNGDTAVIRCLDPHLAVPNGIAPASILEEQPQLIVQSYFTGSLALEDLFIEGEVELDTLKAICHMCPELNKLILLEGRVRLEDKSLETFSEQEISCYFSRLKKLRVFTCTDSDGPLSTHISKATSPFLTSLELALDGDFIPRFDFLTECVNLKVLKLSPEFHPPLKNYFSEPVNAQQFLPKLEEVQLEFCMNAELEELFLNKCSLKSIDILCLHHLGQTDDQLFQLFMQWPQLVSFKYKMPRKFTVEMILKLLHHLPCIKSISLYKDIKYRCLADFHLLKKSCRLRNIKLDLQFFLDTYLCIDGDINDEMISTSDESETEY